MATVNLSLMANTRTTVKKAYGDIAHAREKTGKEKVRDGMDRETAKSIRRHSALTQKFLSEQGKGGKIDTSL